MCWAVFLKIIFEYNGRVDYSNIQAFGIVVLYFYFVLIFVDCILGIEGVVFLFGGFGDGNVLFGLAQGCN